MIVSTPVYTPGVDFARILALAITVAALFSYINQRWVRLPGAIGLLLMGLAVSIVLAGAGRWLPELQRTALATQGAIDFNRLVLHGVLGPLLFAGALQLNLDDLRRHAAVIAVLSTVGVIASTVIVGWLTWQVLGWLGIGLPLIDCLLFGALISPTDPIAVLAVIRSRVSKDLEVQLAGESLFNDGIGVVVFLTLLRLAGPRGSDVTIEAAAAALLFVQETLGGIALGAVTGVIAFVLIKTVNDYRIEILLSLALVLGGYTLAEALHVSAPLATVVAGLLIGNHGRAFAMSEATRERLDVFWEVIDEILKAVLFVLIGLQLLAVEVTREVLVAGAAAVVVTVLARWLSTGIPLTLMRQYARVPTPSVGLMTWAGVRGPLSIALALSLSQHLAAPASRGTPVIVVMTYAVVIFSVAIQGVTLGPMIRRAGRA
jgi:CPA1 family monovalent cation:H+ antiporter